MSWWFGHRRRTRCGRATTSSIPWVRTGAAPQVPAREAGHAERSGQSRSRETIDQASRPSCPPVSVTSRPIRRAMTTSARRPPAQLAMMYRHPEPTQEIATWRREGGGWRRRFHLGSPEVSPGGEDATMLLPATIVDNVTRGGRGIRRVSASRASQRDCRARPQRRGSSAVTRWST